MKNIIFITVILFAFACSKKDDPKPQPKSAILHIAFQSPNDSIIIQLVDNTHGYKTIGNWHAIKTGSMYTFTKDTLITSGININIGGSSKAFVTLQSGTYLVAYYNGVRLDSITTYNNNPGPPFPTDDMEITAQLPTIY